MSRGGILQHMRGAGLLLALFALVFKAALPPGFMLDATPGGLTIVLCNGANAVFDPRAGAITPDGDHDPSKADTSQHCPFAMAAAPVLHAPATNVAAPASAFVHAVAPVREATGPRKATGPPLPARGPPPQA